MTILQFVNSYGLVTHLPLGPRIGMDGGEALAAEPRREGGGP